MSTYFPSGNGLAENRKWHVVDADGKTVGHLASEVAAILSGKRNPQWTPFMDMGDHVIVVNARKAMFTGAKATDKIYRRHTLYPGGLRETSVTEMLAPLSHYTRKSLAIQSVQALFACFKAALSSVRKFLLNKSMFFLYIINY